MDQPVHGTLRGQPSNHADTPLLFAAHELPVFPRAIPRLRQHRYPDPAFQLDLLSLPTQRKPRQSDFECEVFTLRWSGPIQRDNIHPVNWISVARLDSISHFGSYVSMRRHGVLKLSFLSITASDHSLEDVSNRLYLAGVDLVGDVVQLTSEQIQNITGADDETMERVSSLLGQYNLALGKRIPGWDSVTPGRR